MLPHSTQSLIRKLILLSALLLIFFPCKAQHPLVGTWEMVSVKGIDADGAPFFHDTTTVRETKIITPTHYMLIAWDVDDGALTFNRTMAGRVALEGEKYIEIPTHASVQIFENVKVDFRWKLEGDRFIQSGSIVRPDGKRVVLEALEFRRLTSVPTNENNPGIGTWQESEGHYLTSDGKKKLTLSNPDSRLLIVTPTHWMRMDMKNRKFDGAMYGNYTLLGETVISRSSFSTYSNSTTATHEFSQKVSGDRMQLIYPGTSPEGQGVTFYDDFQKMR